MAYTESIKDLERLRKILLNFYVDGSKTKEDYLPSFYRGASFVIENALGEDVQTTRKNGKSKKSISLDARIHQVNPLYKLFFLKSFNNNDISLHFHIIDILSDRKRKRLADITEELRQRYFDYFEDSDKNTTQKDNFQDTVRNKLEEMVSLGIIDAISVGNRFEYSLPEDIVSINGMEDAISFFSSSFPSGVLGEIIKQEYLEENKDDIFVFKHNYINHALDADVLCVALNAAKESRKVEFDYDTRSQREDQYRFSVFPIKVYSSVSEGRQYLFSYNYNNNHYTFFRLDKIHNMKVGEKDEMADNHRAFFEENRKKMWGSSLNNEWKTEHVEFVLSIPVSEGFVLSRLNREKRNCDVRKIEEEKYLVSVDVVDPRAMVPWIRTFYGRLESFSSSDENITKEIQEDIKSLKEYYDAL